MSNFLSNAIGKQVGPQTNSRGQKAIETAEAIKQLSLQSALNLVKAVNQGVDLVWENPYGLSPQEVCDKLGTDAQSIFVNHRDAVKFLVSQVPELEAALKKVPEGNEINYNEDGTVTITEK